MKKKPIPGVREAFTSRTGKSSSQVDHWAHFPDRTYGSLPGTRVRDPGNYRVALFGSPEDAEWGWRIGGHHLSLHFTVRGGSIAATTAFYGTGPARAKMPGGIMPGARLLRPSRGPDRRAVRRRLRQQRDGPRTAFAWAGSDEFVAPHYYRVQGERLLIEYDCTQNDANHTHSVLRDPLGDFGTDLLSQHYAAAHG